MTDPDQALKIALDIATAAAKAAPDFAATVQDAIYSIPSIASSKGSLAQLQKAVFAGVKAAESEGWTGGSNYNPPGSHSGQDFGGNPGSVTVSPAH